MLFILLISMQSQIFAIPPTEGLQNFLSVLMASSIPREIHSHLPMQALETRQGLPFAIIVGNETRLTIHLRDPDFKEAFYSTALISPTGLCESFPSSWVWPHVTCVVFTRIHRWDKASIENNLTALTEAAASRNSLVVLHIEFESDLRYLDIKIEPQYILRL